MHNALKTNSKLCNALHKIERQRNSEKSSFKYNSHEYSCTTEILTAVVRKNSQLLHYKDFIYDEKINNIKNKIKLY